MTTDDLQFAREFLLRHHGDVQPWDRTPDILYDAATRLTDAAEADRILGARLRAILVVTGHDADSLEAAEGEPHRAGLADFALRLVVALREEVPDVG